MANGIDVLIQQLNTELLGLGEMVQEAIGMASQALVSQDVAKAEHTIELSAEARLKEREVEGICLRLLLRYQPVARDLRVVSAALKMITDMERISDQSGDISNIIIELAGKPYIKQLDHLP